jgi:hypothetical protein
LSGNNATDLHTYDSLIYLDWQMWQLKANKTQKYDLFMLHVFLSCYNRGDMFWEKITQNVFNDIM